MHADSSRRPPSGHQSEPCPSVLIPTYIPAPRTCTHQLHFSPALLRNYASTQKRLCKTYSTLKHSTLSRLVPHHIRPKQQKDTRYASIFRPSICYYYATASLSIFALLLVLLSPISYLAYCDPANFSLPAYVSKRQKKSRNPPSSHWALSTAQFTQPLPPSTIQHSAPQRTRQSFGSFPLPSSQSTVTGNC